MNTPSTEIQISAAGRLHARYSDEFKRQIVAACGAPGSSKAAIALANGLNANMLRRWVVQSSQASHGQLLTTTQPLPSVQANADFIPVKLTPAPSTQAGDIRIELQHAEGNRCIPVTQCPLYPKIPDLSPLTMGLSTQFTTNKLSSHLACFSSPARLATVAAILDSPAVAVCFKPSLPPVTLSNRISGTGFRVWAVLAL